MHLFPTKSSAAPERGRQSMANGRILLYEENPSSEVQRRRTAAATSLHSGTIDIEAVPLDRCRICGSNTARLVNARKGKWTCATCGETYRL